STGRTSSSTPPSGTWRIGSRPSRSRTFHRPRSRRRRGEGAGVSASPSLHAVLADRVPAMRDDFVLLLLERIPFYRTMPEERLKGAVEHMLTVFLDALPAWDPAPVISYVATNLVQRAGQGLDLEGALERVMCFQRTIQRSIDALLAV